MPITFVHFSHTGEQLWVRLCLSRLRDRRLPLPSCVTASNRICAAFPMVYNSLQNYWSPWRVILQVNVGGWLEGRGGKKRRKGRRKVGEEKGRREEVVGGRVVGWREGGWSEREGRMGGKGGEDVITCEEIRLHTCIVLH